MKRILYKKYATAKNIQNNTLWFITEIDNNIRTTVSDIQV